MSLALEVGILADLKTSDEEGLAYYRKQFGTVNDVLRSEGLPRHQEPEEVVDVFSCGMWGYSGLHYLRRVAAHLALGRPVPPPGDEDAAHDPVLEVEYSDRFLGAEPLAYQHLVIHSDAEGFYVPVDFEPALIVTEFELAGGMLGSTQRLLAECRELAKILGMPLDLHHESDEVWHAAESQDPGAAGWRRYGVETFTCLRLIVAGEASLRTKAAIAFV